MKLKFVLRTQKERKSKVQENFEIGFGGKDGSE